MFCLLREQGADKRRIKFSLHRIYLQQTEEECRNWLRNDDADVFEEIDKDMMLMMMSILTTTKTTSLSFIDIHSIFASLFYIKKKFIEI